MPLNPFQPLTQPLTYARPAFDLRPRRFPGQQDQGTPELTPEEEESLLRSIGSKTLSGIATVAAPLDYVGGGIRNLLTGQMPAANPFSYEGRATGRDVLEKWGLAPKNIKGFSPIKQPVDALWDVAGFATEVATDPLTYMTLGMSALAKGGKALKSAGLLDFAPDVFGKLKVDKAGKLLGRNELRGLTPEAIESLGSVGPRMGRMKVTPRRFIRELPDEVRKVASTRMKDVAREAGMGGKEYAEMMNKPIGGLAGLGPPFMQPWAVAGRAGTLAEPIARGIDWLGHAARYSLPIRAAAAGFSKPLMREMTETGQKAAAAASRLGGFKTVQDRMRLAGHISTFRALGLLTEDIGGVENGRYMRQYLEGTLPKEGIRRMVSGFFDEGKWVPVTRLGKEGKVRYRGQGSVSQSERQMLPKHIEPAREALDDMRRMVDEALTSEQAMGLSTRELNDFIKNFPRQLVHFGDESFGGGGKLSSLTATHQFQLPREDFLTNLAKGSEVINRMSLDAKISGTISRTKISPRMTNYLRKEMTDRLKKQGRDAAGKVVDPEKALNSIEINLALHSAFPPRAGGKVDLDKAAEYITKTYGKDLYDEMGDLSNKKVKDIAHWLANRDARHVATGIPVFGNHPLADLMKRMEHGRHAEAGANAIYDLIGKTAKHFDDVPEGERWVRVGAGGADSPSLLEQAHLTGPGAHAKAIGSLPDDVKGRFFQEGVDPARIPEHISDAAQRRFGEMGPKVTRSYPIDNETILANVWVPPDIAADIVRLNKAVTAPEFLRPFLDIYQSYTNWFRAHVTAYWPAFIGRNQMGGLLQNWIGGAYGSGFGKAGMLQSVKAANLIVDGAETIPNVLDMPIVKRAGITDAKQATQMIRELYFAHGGGGKMMAEYAAQLGETSYRSMGDMLTEMPGMHPWKWRETLGALDPRKPGALKPWKTRGVGKTTESQFALSKWGEAMNYKVEIINRLSPFISMLHRGIDPTVAMRRVKLLQVDYMAGAAGDKIARNIFPFWSFVKGQAQYIAKELTTKPGGGLAQALRAESLMSREGLPPLLPEHVQTSAAIPLPPGPTGATRILGSLGLMHEDPLQGLAMDPTRPFSTLPRNMLLEAAGRLNPIPKMLIEEATGRSVFQAGPRGGRALADMEPALGRMLSNIIGSEEPVQTPRIAERAQEMFVPRWVSTTKKVLDPRKEAWAKGLNTLTGMKITDVPPRVQDALLREGVSERMQELGARSFTRDYFPKSMLNKMPPEKRQAAIEMQAIMNMLAKRARERAKAAEEL